MCLRIQFYIHQRASLVSLIIITYVANKLAVFYKEQQNDRLTDRPSKVEVNLKLILENEIIPFLLVNFKEVLKYLDNPIGRSFYKDNPGPQCLRV